jgi:hypothetical protein
MNISLLPRGALTSKPFAFKIRPWELLSVETLNLNDHFLNEIYIQYKGNIITRILPKKNNLSYSLISDTARFSFDSLYFNSSFTGDSTNSISYKFLRGVNLKFIVIVDNTIELELLKIFKFLNSSTDTFLFYQENRVFSPFFVYVWNARNILKSFDHFSKNCFICSTLLNVESILLNIKIRLKFNKTRLNIFQFGYYSISNFSILFFSLKLQYFFALIKSKSLIQLQMKSNFNKSLFIMGESLTRRFKDLSSIVSILAHKFKTCLFYFVSKQTSLESSLCNSMKVLTKRLLERNNNRIFVNLDSTAQLLSLVTSCNTNFINNNILFSMYDTTLNKHSKKYYRMGASLESSGVYINIEQSIKKKMNLTIVSNEYAGNLIFRTLYSFNVLKPFYCLFTRAIDKSKLSSNFVYIITDFLSSPISGLNKLQSNFNLFIYFPNCYFLFSYPDKTLFEDSYRSTIDKKYSLTMLECSRNERKQSSNFLI